MYIKTYTQHIEEKRNKHIEKIYSYKCSDVLNVNGIYQFSLVIIGNSSYRKWMDNALYIYIYIYFAVFNIYIYTYWYKSMKNTLHWQVISKICSNENHEQ